MPEPILTFEVDGDVQLARGFSRFADDVKDLRVPFRGIFGGAYIEGGTVCALRFCRDSTSW